MNSIFLAIFILCVPFGRIFNFLVSCHRRRIKMIRVFFCCCCWQGPPAIGKAIATGFRLCGNCHVLTHYASCTDKTYLWFGGPRTMSRVYLKLRATMHSKCFFFFCMSKGIGPARKLNMAKTNEKGNHFAATSSTTEKKKITQPYVVQSLTISQAAEWCENKKKEEDSKCIFVVRHVYALTHSSIRVWTKSAR